MATLWEMAEGTVLVGLTYLGASALTLLANLL